MPHDYLVETYGTERLKVLGVWAMFDHQDLLSRPGGNERGRSVLEQFVHQCMSEDLWFRSFFGIDVSAPPLPESETRIDFMRQYGMDSSRRLVVLREKDDVWWETEVDFFDARRSRAWVMVRRIAHTAHHRGQQTAMLRMLARPVYSTYGPTADTGGLMKDKAPTVYAYPDEENLLAGGDKAALPESVGRAVTERPSSPDDEN
jgi:uncharacterized damage-inducible protein DinB